MAYRLVVIGLCLVQRQRGIGRIETLYSRSPRFTLWVSVTATVAMVPSISLRDIRESWAST